MSVAKELINEWYNALSLDSFQLVNTHVSAFKKEHPDIYYLFHSFYRLRHELNEDIKLMSHVGLVQWFTLTFDNKHDKSLVSSKRKSATRFLNDLFLCYTIVEEYGEDNNRYHIHGFGVYRDNKSWCDFCKWHSRNKIETMNEERLKRKVKYLTNYTIKSLPRLRRSKNMVYLRNRVKLSKTYKKNFNDCYKCRVNLTVLRLRLNAL